MDVRQLYAIGLVIALIAVITLGVIMARRQATGGQAAVGELARLQTGGVGAPSVDNKCNLFAEDRLICGDPHVNERECLALNCCYGRVSSQAFNCYHPAGSRGARWAERTGMMRLCLQKRGHRNAMAMSTEQAREELVKAVQRMRGGGDQSGLANAELLARLGCAIGGTYRPAVATGVNCDWTKTYHCPSSSVRSSESAIKHKGKRRATASDSSLSLEFTPNYDACCRERLTGWSTEYPEPER